MDVYLHMNGSSEYNTRINLLHFGVERVSLVWCVVASHMLHVHSSQPVRRSRWLFGAWMVGCVTASGPVDRACACVGRAYNSGDRTYNQ